MLCPKCAQSPGTAQLVTINGDAYCKQCKIWFNLTTGKIVDNKEIVNEEQMAKTLAGLKKFREANWDKSLNRDEAYKKYINLY